MGVVDAERESARVVVGAARGVCTGADLPFLRPPAAAAAPQFSCERGGVDDTQRVLPFGRPGEVADEVKRRIDDLAPWRWIRLCCCPQYPGICSP